MGRLEAAGDPRPAKRTTMPDDLEDTAGEHHRTATVKSKRKRDDPSLDKAFDHTTKHIEGNGDALYAADSMQEGNAQGETVAGKADEPEPVSDEPTESGIVSDTSLRNA